MRFTKRRMLHDASKDAQQFRGFARTSRGNDAVSGQERGLQAAPAIGCAGWLETLAFTPRKESWVATSEGWFYKVFRGSNDPGRDWLDVACIARARREYNDMLFLHQLSDRVCLPERVEGACVAYPQLTGPDLHVFLRQRGPGDAKSMHAIAEAIVLLARLHSGSSRAAHYPVKDYLLRDSFLSPQPDVAERMAARCRTVVVTGFEVRNLRFDENRDGWYFFDPQHVWQGFPEEDFARFVISLWMINWGRRGNIHPWTGFRVSDLIRTYERNAPAPLDRRLLDYFFHEQLAKRKFYAGKSLRAMSFLTRRLASVYSASYFGQIERGLMNHEF